MTSRQLQFFLSRIVFVERGALWGPCWEWQGRHNAWGYAEVGGYLAHRRAYEHWRGPIPQGLTLDHLCRYPGCVSPWHLEAVTIRVNILRGNTLAARELQRQHCPAGHPYDATNTYLDPDGRRHCRMCQRGNRRRWEQRHGHEGRDEKPVRNAPHIVQV